MPFEPLDTQPDEIVLAYSIHDVAQRLGVSERHVHRLVMRGELQSRKLGRRRLIPRSSITAWLRGDSILHTAIPAAPDP